MDKISSSSTLSLPSYGVQKAKPVLLEDYKDDSCTLKYSSPCFLHKWHSTLYIFSETLEKCFSYKYINQFHILHLHSILLHGYITFTYLKIYFYLLKNYGIRVFPILHCYNSKHAVSCRSPVFYLKNQTVRSSCAPTNSCSSAKVTTVVIKPDGTQMSWS